MEEEFYIHFLCMHKKSVKGLREGAALWWSVRQSLTKLFIVVTVLSSSGTLSYTLVKGRALNKPVVDFFRVTKKMEGEFYIHFLCMHKKSVKGLREGAALCRGVGQRPAIMKGCYGRGCCIAR